MKRISAACALGLVLWAGAACAQTSAIPPGSYPEPPAAPNLYPTMAAHNPAPSGKAGQPGGGFQIQGGAEPSQAQAGGQMSSGAPAASQVPTNGIEPVDNQAILNGLATAASPAGGANGDAARQAVFRAALDSVFPFSPQEIQTLFDRLHENQQAIAGPAQGSPKAEVKAETVSLDPGSEPKLIETDVGFVTTVSFLDATGNPWPIQDIGVGGNFDVPAPEEGGNVIRITPLARYAVGNLSIRLFGLTTPLAFRLSATTGHVDYRYDARVPKLGPKAEAPLIDHGNDLVAGDSMLMNILDGAPPITSTRLTVVGVDSRTAAWRIGSKIFVRTPYMLLSPGWDGTVGSGDGTRVYEIPDTPVLLLSDNGNLVHARIGNNAKPDEQPVPAIEDGVAHPLRASAAATAAADASEPLITRSGSSSGSEASSAASAPSRTLIRPVQVGGGAAQPAANNASAGASNSQQAPTAQAGSQTQGTQQ